MSKYGVLHFLGLCDIIWHKFADNGIGKMKQFLALFVISVIIACGPNKVDTPKIEVNVWQATQDEVERFNKGDSCLKTEVIPLEDAYVSVRTDGTSGDVITFTGTVTGTGFSYGAFKDTVSVDFRQGLNVTSLEITSQLYGLESRAE